MEYYTIDYTEEKIRELDQYYSSPSNLVELFENSVKKYGERELFGVKNPATKQYEWLTYLQVARRVDNLRSGLHKLGFAKGDTIGVIVSNSPEWFIVEQATHGLGGRYVPMYEKELQRTWRYIIEDSAIKYLFVRDRKILELVTGFAAEIPTLEKVMVIFGGGDDSLKALEETGEAEPVDSYHPHWSEVANLIYTSGTTGDPKGVLLTHGNLTHCSQAGREIFPELGRDSVSLSILPWAHSYGLSAELHNFILLGGGLGIMESVDTLADDLKAVKPTYLIAVPRIFNKIYDGIQSKMREAGGLKKLLFDAACAEAKKCRDKQKSLKLKLLDKVVFSKIRERFGGRLQGVMTASAIMNPEIARFFFDIGLPTFDCYGLTETAPAITMNSPLAGNRYGSVGKPVRNMHVKIDRTRVGEESEDGEVVAYGAHVMLGYHNKPEQTKGMMTADTWQGFPGVYTGDLGRIDDDGYLYITGRHKDEYKLANGKFVHPEALETDMKLIPQVANAFLYGLGKAYNVALVVPDFQVIKNDAESANWSGMAPEEMVVDEAFRAFMRSTIEQHLKRSFGGYEIPKKYLFVTEDFSIENGMLTQTLKLKRRAVFDMYGEQLVTIYDQ